MKFKQLNIVAVIFLCQIFLGWASERVENQIGPFNLAISLMTESELVSSFGQGYVQIEKVEDVILGKKHIYYIKAEKVWVEVRLSHVLDEKLERFIEAVLITKEKLCDEKFEPDKSLGPLITGKGIKIGDSLAKVIRAYGKPSVSIDVGKDRSVSALVEDLKLQKGRVLRYLTDPNEMLFSEFYFGEKGLHSILISAEE